MQGEEGKIWSPEAAEASKTSNRYAFTVRPLLAKSNIVRGEKEATGALSPRFHRADFKLNLSRENKSCPIGATKSLLAHKD